MLKRTSPLTSKPGNPDASGADKVRNKAAQARRLFEENIQRSIECLHRIGFKKLYREKQARQEISLQQLGYPADTLNVSCDV
jgi:hypothetical protein